MFQSHEREICSYFPLLFTCFSNGSKKVSCNVNPLSESKVRALHKPIFEFDIPKMGLI